ncbi:unnamed protein product [Closterium sp. NIES-54]
MDTEIASWKSTGTYVDEVHPHGANIVDGMWIFRVKRPPGSPPAFKARYVARGFSQRQGVDYFHTFSPTPTMTTLRVLLHVAAQRDYELHSLDFSTAFLQGSLHEEIWLCRPPGFTGSFPAGTQWSLRQPVYGLRQAPREWHDTLRTTLAALGFSPSSADPSLFLCTDTTLPPFYVLVYVDDLVFATTDTEAMSLLSAPSSDESVELSGPYPELVGCLMYLMTCTRPDLAYPLSLLACYVAPVVFQHDNDPKHTCKLVKNYLAQQPHSILPWPASSPDHDPIEHLWVYLKKQLVAYPRPPAGIRELWDRIQVEWEKIPEAWCTELIDIMPRRVRAVLKARGRWAKY